MGLFDKKFCDVCGQKIKLLGNRKLEDGNLCKECASKLSPWFSERKHSTVAEIKNQLEYRENNKIEVQNFHPTLTLGKYYKVIIDEDNGKFMVTRGRGTAEENPDVLSLADVTGCNVDVSESREEMKRKDKDGNMVSFVPAQYEYSYDFTMTINVNNPYFNQMRFPLTNDSITIENTFARGMSGQMSRAQAAAAASQHIINGGSLTSQRPDPTQNFEYQECAKLAEEIKSYLLQTRQEIREAAKPKTAVTCPHCGASTIPDANGRCEYCGGALL